MDADGADLLAELEQGAAPLFATGAELPLHEADASSPKLAQAIAK